MSELTLRELCPRNEVDLYEDGHYAGFQRIETIVEYYEEYAEKAELRARRVSCDSVVLYAIFEYDSDSQKMLSADFTMLEIPFEDYVEFVNRLGSDKRLFFIRGRREYYYDV